MSELERTVVRTLREQRAYGKYRGFVQDNADPDKLARLKVLVPAILGDQGTDWALPCLPCGGAAGHGFVCVPEVGAQVWVEFEGGDLRRPIWTGTFWQQPADVPAEFADQTTTRLWRTSAGHLLLFEDKSGEEHLQLKHAGGANLDIDADGSVALTDAGGARVLLDAQNNQIVVEDANGNTLTLSGSGTTVEDAAGNRIELAAAGVTVKGTKIVLDGQQVLLGGEGGEPVIKGQSFLTLFATHIHTCGAPGSPSTPPIPQGEMSTLSFKVKTG